MEHAGHDERGRGLGRAFMLGLAATLGLAAVEALVGVYTGSLTVLTDAGHNAVDSIGIALALVATLLARRPPDLRRTYGYARVEVLVIPAQVSLMVGLAAYVAYEAVSRIGDTPEIDAVPVLLTGLAGLSVNLLVLRVVSPHGHTNLNARAAFYEVVADALGSVGVVLAAVVLLTTGWAMVDVLVSLGIAILLVPRAFVLLRHAVLVLLEGVPPEVDTAAIRRAAETVPGVRGLHDLHVWALAPGFIALSAHVDLERMEECAQPLGLLSTLLRERFGIAHVTLQPETRESHANLECCLYPDAVRLEHQHA